MPKNNSLPQIMGIVNVTPDSFSDGGQFLSMDSAVAHGIRLMQEGATMLDIGGESTRPNAKPVSVEEEIARVVPVIHALKHEAEKRNVRLSIDTRNAKTMRAAIDAGASMINDVSALTHDRDSLSIAAASGKTIILMHMQGTPETMQQAPKYKNVLYDVFEYLEGRIAVCMAAGINKKNLIIDPGLGFGKTAQQNMILLSQARHFQKLGVPVLIGASRKSFLSIATDAAGPENRLPASLAAAIMAFNQGAQYLRVHDVKETRQALMIWQALADIDMPV